MSFRFGPTTSLDAGAISNATCCLTDRLMHSLEMRCACVIHIKVALMQAECMYSEHSSSGVPLVPATPGTKCA